MWRRPSHANNELDMYWAPIVRRRVIFRTMLLGAALAAVAGAGCVEHHEQSMLHPAGPAAARIDQLWWFLLIVCGGVFLVTMGLLVAALAARPTPNNESPLGMRFIVGSGIVLPGIILLVILIHSLQATVALKASQAEPLAIRVIGHKWWWEVHYPQQNITTANEIHLPAGRPVRFELRAADVIHSFWVPNLGGKMDLLPEHDTILWLQADHPGVWRGQCAEYCGGPHAQMAFPVVVHEEEDFAAWVEANQGPVSEPETARLQTGHDVFFRAACHNCHAIRGTEAAGRIGPDLTHMGSRRTLGAAAVVNDHERLVAWISDPQVDKPGNFMPRSSLSREELETLADYLLSLK